MQINEIIKKLVIKCDLGNINEQPKRVSGGLLNRIYKIKTDKGTYAIKLLNPEVMKRPTAMSRHIFAERVANIAKQNEINCLPSKIINNETIQEVNGYYFLIFDWVEGKSITEEELTIEKCKKVATELSKLHKINFDDMKNETESHYSKEEVDWDFYIQRLTNKKLKELLIENKDRFNKLDQKAIKALKIIEKNVVISHSDLDLPNVLWDNEEPILIDWESVGAINPSMELIDTAWNWSGGQNYFDIEKFKIFIQTYEENGGDISEFNLAIDANFKAKSGWLEYNLKRVCGIECLDREEQILGEKEVIRSIDEINKFYYFMRNIKETE